nr:ribonuclease H-like domain-containing protein [Tanacetum cinerariifolium]
MPHKPNLVFTDESNARESVTTVFNVESSTNKPSKDMSMTHSNGLGPQKTLNFLFDVHGNLQQALKDKGVIDSGFSRHMTGNISFLLKFEETDRGYVTFGGNHKGGKISGKGKPKTGKLNFDDVYFVKELKFNLLSVSQMCDKKNSVFFIDTKCVVLSSDFKLPVENHVFLRVPRENNMYNVDLKNIYGYPFPFGLRQLILSAMYKIGTNRVNAVSAPVNVAEPNSTNRTNSFNTSIPYFGNVVNAISLNIGIARKSSFLDPSKYPDDPDMPELEDIVYSDDEEDVGEKVDLSNLETNIRVSPIPTTRVHKDHPINQIIGNLNSAP